MRNIDYPLLLSVTMLNIFGLLMIYEASSFMAFRDFENKFHYLQEQAVWSALGFVGLTFFSYFDYRRLYSFALPILIGAIGLLIAVQMV